MEAKIIDHEEAMKLGIREAIKYIKETEYNKKNKMYDRRLRNTRLLLKSYRNLQFHKEMCINIKNSVAKENTSDILDDLDFEDNAEQYIQSIARTKTRTKLMLDHMDKALRYYKNICVTDSRERKYNIIHYIYIDENNENTKTYEEAAEQFNVSIKTISRDVREAIEDLAILFFGIDGLKL